MSGAPHDLLRLRPGAAVVHELRPPAWADEHLARARTVVVRRARCLDGLLPVGVRGATRSERLAAWLSPRDVAERIRPEDLAARRGWLDPARRRVPALDALGAVADLLDGAGLAWGPVGGAGFELATGLACLGPGSDLDVLVRAPTRLPRDGARRLLAALGAVAVRVDVALETPAGAVALAEHAGGGARVMLRTADGPRLVADAWSPG